MVEEDSSYLDEDMEEEVRRAIKELRGDPLYLAILMNKLYKEREATNMLLKTLLNRIERLEKHLLGHYSKSDDEIILSETDQAIYNFVKELGKVTAEDVRKRFNYKGQNGASARLNKLYNMGLLNKTYVGKKVYFTPAR